MSSSHANIPRGRYWRSRQATCAAPARSRSRGRWNNAVTREGGTAQSARSAGRDLDALDRAATVRAVTSARPDAIVHQLTAIPANLNLRRFHREFARRIGCEPRARTTCSRQRGRPACAESWRRALRVGATSEPADPSKRRTIDWIPVLRPPFAGRWMRFATWKRHCSPQKVIEAIALRYGWFYGPGTSLGRGAAIIHAIRRRHSRSSATAPGSGRSSTSPTRRPRRWLHSSAAFRASITSPMTSPRRCASGCHFWPARLVRRRRDAYPPGWRGS